MRSALKTVIASVAACLALTATPAAASPETGREANTQQIIDAEQTTYLLSLWRSSEHAENELETAAAAYVDALARLVLDEMFMGEPRVGAHQNATADPRENVAAALRAYNSAATTSLRAEAERRIYAAAVGAQSEVGPGSCPKAVPDGVLRDGASLELCARSVVTSATPLAARATVAAFRLLGTPYACEGSGRLGPSAFDCSSLIAAAYTDAGFALIKDGWAPSTRDMFPWDGARRAAWAEPIDPADSRPGDLVLYVGSTHHVAMMLSDGFMLHTASCGDVAHVRRLRPLAPARGFRGVRRVNPADTP